MVATYVEPSPAETRAHAQLRHILDSWRRSMSGKAQGFSDGLENWLRLSASDHTRRGYSFSVFEFFDWHEITLGTLPLPDRVERKTAQQYVDYLMDRDEGLDEQRLARDGRFKLELAAYRAIKRQPGIDEPGIRLALEAEQPLLVSKLDRERPGWFVRFAACLVTRKLADRSPTYYELRTLYRKTEPPPYRYRIHVHSSARGVERSSTVVTRIEALSSLWSWWIDHSGENTGSRRLLDFNIWAPISERYAEAAIAQKRASRELTTMSLDTFKRLVASTYMGDARSLENLRDRAVLLFMFYTASRREEVVALKRSSVTGDPPIVTVLGKRQKLRQFALPLEVIPHLRALSVRLAELADDKKASDERRAWAGRMLKDEAPLFPAVSRRGCAASAKDGLSPSGLNMIFRRRALEHGMGEPEILRTIHPHAVRHLAAKIAVGLGTPLPRVQAVMGHEHLSTTGVYAEEHDPRAMTLFRPPPGPPPAPTAVLAPPPPPPEELAPPRGPVVDVELVEPEAPLLAPRVEPPRAPVPVSRQIVEVGGPPLRPKRALGTEEAPRDALRHLDELYRPGAWGERGEGQRTKLHAKKESLPGFDADEDRLTHTYMGVWSHLVWWDGFSGMLKPSMPVMSERQAFGAEARFGKGIEAALGELWVSWYESRAEKYGPTAAAALVQWVKEALTTMDQVELDREEKGIAWVAFDAPIDDTAETFREQREDMILAWFEVRGNVWTMTPGRTGTKGKGERPGHTADEVKVPDFYYDPDPVLAIPEAERSDFFDWLAAMTAKVPSSPEKRFLAHPDDLAPTLTRKDLAGLIALFCAFDRSEDELGDDPGELKRALKVAEGAIDATVQKLSRGRSRLSYTAKTGARKRETRAKLEGAEGHERESRRKFHMRILGELFGEAAGKDPVLALLTACGSEPLAGGDYADFFRVEGGTIKHKPDFAKAFAKETGAHSECVARRIARSLYELQKEGGRQVSEARRSELENELAAWSAFKVSCPEALEGELRERLGAARAPLEPMFEEALRKQLDRRGVEGAFDEYVEQQKASGEAEGKSEQELRREFEEEVLARLGGGAGRESFELRGLGEGGGFHKTGGRSGGRAGEHDYWRPEEFAKNARSAARRAPQPVTMVFWLERTKRVRSARVRGR